MLVISDGMRPADFLRLNDLGADTLPLVEVAARHTLLPHPATVEAMGGSVFPTIRDQRNRLTLSDIDGRRVMLDDNVTPRWALLWAHGISATHHPKGWTFAHVWGRPRDPNAYTHLANLCMMPEFFGSMSDKKGPLCAYLRHHAHQQYGWAPDGEPDPEEPHGYLSIDWRYLPRIDDPRGYIRDRMAGLRNQRIVMLRGLAEET